MRNPAHAMGGDSLCNTTAPPPPHTHRDDDDDDDDDDGDVTFVKDLKCLV